MVDVRPPDAYHFPTRKPVPTPHTPANNAVPQPFTRIIPDLEVSGQKQQSSPPQHSSYSRTSTQSLTSPYNNVAHTSRRTPSTSTTSTSNTTSIPSRTSSTISTPLSRTSSSRSGQSITSSSYVALMRKQKATVWCDRAQREDPRILAQQKAAKMRAMREVSGGANTVGRSSTSGSMGSGSLGVRSKIRHHGLPKASGYSYGNMMGGAGVPMRLSANEVGDEGNTRTSRDSSGLISHHRADSRGSSMGNGNSTLNPTDWRSTRYSEGSTPNSRNEGDIPELEETPVPGDSQSRNDYFGSGAGGNQGSGNSSETEFGDLGQMQAPTAATTAKREEGKSAEELRRRGSVDERANTMSGVRLFVANPDLSD
ncbi:MAG: hypothetical protein Q9214_000632 [Letrouitia sp. 1 TL-2023]